MGHLPSEESGAARKSLKDLLRAMPSVGSDADFRRKRQKPRRVRL
jgi:hypothetical protein